jgi:hypothetical protein
LEVELKSSPARAIVSGERPSAGEFSDSDDESDDDDNDHGRLTASELNHIGSYLRETVRCLLRLSMTIQNPAPHDRYMKGSKVDTSHFELFDTQHVCSKFPKADEFVTHRLGKAISTRRQFLKYSENHRKRLKAGLSGNPDGDAQSTVASSLPYKIEYRDYNDHTSQTSFGTSVANSEKLKAPPLPDFARYGEEFECPLCYCIASVKDWNGWK